MAGSSNPGFNPNMQSYSIPDNDLDPQPVPMIDWAAPAPGQPTALVDALTGESVMPGQPFVRFVDPGGQADRLDLSV